MTTQSYVNRTQTQASSEGEAALLGQLSPGHGEHHPQPRTGETVVWFAKAVASRMAVWAVTSVLYLGLICVGLTWFVTGSSLGYSFESVFEGFSMLTWAMLGPVIRVVIGSLMIVVAIGWMLGLIPVERLAKDAVSGAWRMFKMALCHVLQVLLGKYASEIVVEWWSDYSQAGTLALFIGLMAVGGLEGMLLEFASAPSWIALNPWGWVFVPFIGMIAVGGVVGTLVFLWLLVWMLLGLDNSWADRMYHPYGARPSELGWMLVQKRSAMAGKSR